MSIATERTHVFDVGEEVLIEWMQLHHLPDVLRIEQASFSSPWSRESFLKEIESSHIAHAIVAQRAGVVAGYIVAWFVMEEAHIGNIAVDPQMRRQGIARTMLAWLLKQAIQHGCTFAILEVRESNQPAQELYKSMGFNAIDRRRSYYLDPTEDAVVMLKTLSEPDR